VPPAKYRNKEACHQAGYLDADDYPVPDRRGISMNNIMRPPVQKIRVDVLDFSLDKAMAQFAAAIDAQIDRDDASDDFIKEKLHSIIRPSGTDAMTRPYYSSIGRVTAVLAFGYPVWCGRIWCRFNCRNDRGLPIQAAMSPAGQDRPG
jgi:hypothetical protein